MAGSSSVPFIAWTTPLFTILALLILLPGQSHTAPDNIIRNCNLRNLDVCLVTLSVFAQTANKPEVTDADIDRQCTFINETIECLENYADTCMTDMQYEMMELIFDGAWNMQDTYCAPNSTLRRMYKKHAPCLASIGSETKECIKILQTSFEAITTTVWHKKMSYACCTFHAFRNCSSTIVKAKCGEDATKVGDSMKISRIPDLICPPEKFNGQSEICQEIPKTVPKVSKSKSLINKLLNSYTFV